MASAAASGSVYAARRAGKLAGTSCRATTGTTTCSAKAPSASTPSMREPPSPSGSRGATVTRVPIAIARSGPTASTTPTIS